MILLIDTTRPQALSLGLSARGALVAEKNIDFDHHSADILLPAIIDLLQSVKQTVGNLTGLAVVTGPGSFSAVRSGVVTANGLSYGLQLPLVAIAAQQSPDMAALIKVATAQLANARPQVVSPNYGKEPTITQRKK
jgi:tRNA threonylcarbamoyladenosine biosynthesis protein TsaB